jgi:glycosyltransferase involved in cell wall biosynthesis
MNLMISIVIPTFNRAKDLARCIESIPNDLINEHEIIVVDDGSSDNTKIAISNLNRKNLKYYYLEKNKGVSYARNYGIDRANGRYITFIDSDDEFIPIALVNTIIKLRFMEANLIISNFTNSSNSSTVESFGIFSSDTEAEINTENLIKKYLMQPKGNSIMTYCWAKFYEKNFLNKNQIRFDENISIYEDIDFISKVLTNKPRTFAFPEIIYKYNHSIYGLSRSKHNLSKNLIECVLFYGNHIQDKSITKTALDFSLIKIMVENAKNKNYDILTKIIYKYNKEILDISPNIVKSPILKILIILKIVKYKFLFINIIKLLAITGKL